MPPIAHVEPLTTARSLRGPFDYRLPDHLGAVGVGSLLVVPFAGRRVLGVVVGVADRSALAPDRLAEPVEALELGVPPELVPLAAWIAAEYCSTPARALALVLPPGAGSGPRPRVRTRTALAAALTPGGAAALADPGARLGTVQRAALTALADATAPVPLAALPGGSGTLRRLEQRALVAITREVQARRPHTAGVGARRAAAPVLTEEQRAALVPLLAAIEQLDRGSDGRRAQDGDGRAVDHGAGGAVDHGGGRAVDHGAGGSALDPGGAAGAAPDRRFLLHGVTGSGKTEVYLQAAAAALARDRGVIVLVPEIALTPQIVARFQDRFGDTVAVLHSQLGSGERHDEWGRLRRGEARICVGPRSAVFAPVARLGLLVVDEEHDASYKNEGDPRYDARAVAERRAADAGAVLLAGSATPRPESVHRLTRLRLARRVDGQRLPPVAVLDMRDRAHALHPETVAALAEVRRHGRKAIVLLNRRGWSNFLSCRSCGKVWECPQCDVALVLHRSAGRVECHHCGHSERVPDRCDACGSASVARHGAGTERLEHELSTALGDRDFPIVRLDSDVGGGRDRVARALGAFDAAPAGVLLGTQMVAKGHDFPDVTLGVVLDADATLRFPDFRAEERTFALVAQLAGRAGRGPGGGRVLVQTLAPDARAILHAAEHDADAFLREELARREALRYPPFADLIRIVCSAPAAADAHAAGAAIAARLTDPGGSVLGPAPLFRLRGRERVQLVVKAEDRTRAVTAVGDAVAAVAADSAHRGVAFSVDVDPQ